ncbi:hypothetical protein HCN44_006468 [Aphidius gifuensis]|uniref:Uncharacterized protein n=1 Tax=Aphidius gifuensis TaxID=684658 RepID=A0A834XZX4_APHGI|nr:uncharacterized transcriptional regulatory protein YLR278C [Aphidius gifuensis]KAF7995361.1 hypothetical protein HCN44_006468 [Aphidius gifuensis]
MTHANRKRVRNADDESSEFTPLSKRINNLHINSLGKPVNQQIGNNWSNGNNSVTTNNIESSQHSSSSSSCNGYQSQDYRPHLNANDNPYYYENNKLLYSLYTDRMNRRTNDQ